MEIDVDAQMGTGGRADRLPGAGRRLSAGEEQRQRAAVYEQLNLFGEAFERIRQDAVEPVGDDKLIATAIAGMLASLDPHAVYLTEAEYKAQQAPTPEQSGSIGLVVTIENGQLEGGVAARRLAGCGGRDQARRRRSITIDKEPTYDLTLGRGRAAAARAGRQRGHADCCGAAPAAPIEIKVKRGADKLTTVTSHLESGTIGYIRVAGFDDKTAAGARPPRSRICAQQASNKLIGFVVDLRNNPGGNFDAAVATADAFIDKGDIAIVKGAQGRYGKAHRRDAGRPRQRVADRRARQWRHRARGRARRRRAAGQSPRRAARHQDLRRKRDRDDDPAQRQRRDPADDGAVRDAERARDPGQGARARPHRRARSSSNGSRAAISRHEADLRGALKNTDPVAGSAAGASDARRRTDKTPRRRRQIRAAARAGHRHGGKARPGRRAVGRDRRYRHRRRRAADRGARRAARAGADQRPQHPLRGSTAKPCASWCSAPARSAAISAAGWPRPAAT